MKGKLIWTLPAVLLVLGFALVSCDNGTTSSVGVKIPAELQGSYTVGGYLLKINANGKGTLDGAACTFSAANNILTVKLGSNTVDVEYNADPDGSVAFTYTGAKTGYLGYVFTAIGAAGAVMPDQSVTAPPVIPDALVGSWKTTADVTVTGSPQTDAGTVLFVINADGSGQTYNTTGEALNQCTWSVSGNKLTMTVDYTSVGYGILMATFDYGVASNTLTLANAVAGNSNMYSVFLLGYTAFSTFLVKDSGAVTPQISDFIFSNSITGEIAGTWQSAAAGFEAYPPIFLINADGTGQAFISADPYIADCTYSLNTASNKIKITIAGFGGAMYDYSISGGQLNISSPVATSDASPGVSLYGYFDPLEKVVQ